MGKNNEEELNVLVEKIKKLESKGKKRVTIGLSTNDAEYLINLGYALEPFLYKIWTKHIISANNSLLRKIEHKHRLGKKSFVTSLKHNDIVILNELQIKYRPEKYNIYFNLSKTN